MNIVCLNCESVIQTEDPRKKFCGKVCRNRYNVRKSLAKPRKERMGIDRLRGLIQSIESKSKRVGIQRETYQRDEWIDP